MPEMVVLATGSDETPVPSANKGPRRTGLVRIGLVVLTVLASPVVVGDVRTLGESSRDLATDVSRALSDVLAGQEQAIHARDEAAFVQVGATSQATAALRLRYRNLTAMKVAEFHVTASFPRTRAVAGEWTSSLSIEFCFGARGCNRDTVVEESVWRDSASGPVLVSLNPSTNGENRYPQPQPWELTPLSVLLGRDVVVATSAPLKGRLPALLAEIEKAIPVAEQYAVGDKPDYYRVYLASPSDLATWYGAYAEKDLASPIPTGPLHADVVLNDAKLSTYPLPQLLRQQLTFAVSMYGYTYWNQWWLVAGYATNAEHGLNFDMAAQTRSYIHGDWNNSLTELPPADNATTDAIGARLGVAFLAVHRLEMKYGRARLIEFFRRVIRYGGTLAMHSPDIFGTPWPTVEADCIEYIKAF